MHVSLSLISGRGEGGLVGLSMITPSFLAPIIHVNDTGAIDMYLMNVVVCQIFYKNT